MFRYLSLEEGKYALSVKPPFGAAVYSSKIIYREKPFEELTEAEIESAIAQAIWKMFDDERRVFACRLNLSELDIVMADVRVLFIKLDGALVVNPLGFRARTLEIGLVETLVARDVSENISAKAPKKGEIAFALESSSSCAWAIRQDSKNKEFIFANIFPSQTFVYRSAPDEKIYHMSDFPWGSENVISAVSSSLAVSSIVGKEVVRRYASGEMSSEVTKFLRPTISKSFDGFFKGLSAAVLGAKMRKPLVYAMSEDLSDLEIGGLSLPRSLPLKLSFLPFVSEDEIAYHEYSRMSTDSVFNRIAKRRMKWLMSHR